MVESLRERKKLRAREAMVDAGMRLFVERGFAAVTVAEIAAAADVAPRTFHRYFSDKAELLFVADGELRETLATSLARQPPGAAPLAVVEAALAAVCNELAGRREELADRSRLLAEVPALHERELSKRAAQEQLIAKHIAERLGVEIDEDVRPRWWAGVAYATFAAGYQVWLANGGELSARVSSALALLADRDPNPGA